MLRTLTLFRGLVVSKKRLPTVSSKMARATRKLDQIKRKRENEAERLFMEKIEAGKKKRQRIIALALRRALSNAKKKEPKFLRRYELNKLKAAEELKKLKQKATISSTVSLSVAEPIAHKSEKKTYPKKSLHVKKNSTQQKKEEMEAEKNFIQLIEEMKKKRELEAKAVRDTQELFIKKESDAEESKSEMNEVVHLISASETLDKDDSLIEIASAKPPRKRISRQGIKLDIMKEVNETPLTKTDDSKIISPIIDNTFTSSNKFLETDDTEVQESIIPEIQAKVERPVQRESKRQKRTITDKKPTLYSPQLELTPRPPQTISLAGFQEAPLISTGGRAPLEAGLRRPASIFSLDAPVPPLRPRALEALPPVAAVTHALPVSFPHNIPPMRALRESPAPSTGLHRL